MPKFYVADCHHPVTDAERNAMGRAGVRERRIAINLACRDAGLSPRKYFPFNTAGKMAAIAYADKQTKALRHLGVVAFVDECLKVAL